MKRKTIILSGVNLYLGGTLKIMQDCIDALVAYSSGKYRIIVLVHDDGLFKKYDEVEYLSFPLSRKSWLFRLYYEYIRFNKISKQYKPYCWLSLHDSTPNVKADIRAVYCHHAAPFYEGNLGWKEFSMERSFFMFSLFYKWFYKINIQKNDYIVVQQEWMRQAFNSMVQDPKRIIVASPQQKLLLPNSINDVKAKSKQELVFFYPSVPRIFKNFEIIGEAVRILENRGVSGFKVDLTVNGMENKYAKWLYKKYKDLKSLSFSGFLNRQQLEEHYKNCDCIIFPSKLESWGLPVSEAKEYGKPILIADLAYARETVGDYESAKFFDPGNAEELACIMERFIVGNLQYDKTEKIEYKPLYAPDWDYFFDIILKNK